MTPTIDKHIPIPATMEAKCGKRKSIYPFPDMEVGDSVFYPMGNAKSTQDHGPYQNAKNYQARYPDYCFVGRTVVEDGVRGVRIWRTDVAEEGDV